MARAWLTLAPDPLGRAGATIRVVSIEEIVDLRYFEQRLAGIIDSVPRKTNADDVAALLKDAGVQRRPDYAVLGRLARLIDQERMQQQIWRAHGPKLLKDWQSAAGRVSLLPLVPPFVGICCL